VTEILRYAAFTNDPGATRPPSYSTPPGSTRPRCARSPLRSAIRRPPSSPRRQTTPSRGALLQPGIGGVLLRTRDDRDRGRLRRTPSGRRTSVRYPRWPGRRPCSRQRRRAAGHAHERAAARRQRPGRGRRRSTCRAGSATPKQSIPRPVKAAGRHGSPSGASLRAGFHWLRHSRIVVTTCGQLADLELSPSDLLQSTIRARQGSAAQHSRACSPGAPTPPSNTTAYTGDHPKRSSS
jgi:hypothetical protein